MRKLKNTDDQSSIILLSTIIIVLVFVVISYIPPFTLGKVNIRRVNVFSDFIKFQDSTKTLTSKDIIDTSFMAELPKDIVRQISGSHGSSTPEIEPSAQPAAVQHPIEADATGETAEEQASNCGQYTPANVTAGSIEDYSEGQQMTDRLARLLSHNSQEHSIHISFLGDSFIEGDILTATLREKLQKTYGGNGIGYIPFNDPRANNRPAIEQTASGWTCYSLLKKKSVPERNRNDFAVNGYISIPTAGAKAIFKSRGGEGLGCSNASIIFKNRASGHMDVIINGQDSLHYDLETSDEIQKISLAADIQSLEIKLTECDDFVGYGVEFESGTGVYVDNFALRSHSGLNLVGTDRELNRQFGDIVNQDIIVLEYGLNVMQKTVTDYSFFADKLKNVVNFVHLCFPESVIIVMSVGDVGWNNDGTVVTAPAVKPMVASQREASMQCGVMFWDTFQAMGGEGSMKELVNKGWAAKDYTHIRFEGGRLLSDKMATGIFDITAK